MKARLLPSLITAAALVAPSLLSAAAFTPGNLVIARAGTGAAAVTNASTATFLDEYTTAGVLVQSIPLPTAAGTGVNICAIGGTATSEGYMTLSADGLSLVGGCYSSPLGTAIPSGVAPATAPRTIFRADIAGNIDTTTAIGTTTASGAIRGVASSNGTDVWFGTGSGGTFLTTLGSTSGTQIYTTLNNTRGLLIADGQLYGSANSGAFRLFTIGTGLPTTGGQTVTQLNGIPTSALSPYAFFFADLTPAVPGVDTVYLTDDSGGVNGGVRKYSLVGGTWTANGTQLNTNLSSIRGLTGRVSGGTVTLFGTNNSVSLVTFTDTAGYNAVPSSTGGTIIATAAANTVLRGVAFAPAPLQPGLSINATAQVIEGDSPGCVSTPIDFTVTSNTVAPPGGIAFTYSTADGSATFADNDYTQVTAGAGSIAAGDTTTTISVNATCDKNAEANETFAVNLIDGASYELGSPASSTATITDDDTPTFSISDVSLAEGNSGTTAFNFLVTLDRPAPTGGVSFSIATADDVATAPSDFTAVLINGATIAAGSTTYPLTVNVNGDTTIEANEAFGVSLSNLVNLSLVGSDNSGVGLIVNDDIDPFPIITLQGANNVEGNSGAVSRSYSITLSAPAPVGGVSFDVNTSDDTATTADNDYQPVSMIGQVIPAGSMSTTFSVAINGDTVFEPNEQFTITLSNVTNAASFGNVLVASAGILNDDPQPTILSIVPTVAQAEGNSTSINAMMTFAVTLDAPAPVGGITFTPVTANGSADSTDYIALPGTPVTIVEGATAPATPVTVAILGDLVVEGDDTFTVTLTNVTGSSVSIGGANNGVSMATISNDDSAPMTIEQIQGNGHASPVANQTVATIGNIVTAVLPAPNGGFVMQMPDNEASGDTATSNGVLVFTGFTPTIAVGDKVDVRGTLVEFNTAVGATAADRVTEFTNSGLVFNIISSGNALPAPIVLDAMVPSPNPATPSCGAGLGNFECIESMRVTTSTGMINLGNQTFGAGDPVAEMWITTSGQRAVREGGLLRGLETEVLPTLTPPAAPLPTTFIYDGNPEVFELDMDRAGLPNLVVIPGSTFSATGVLTQEFGGFEFFPTQFTTLTEAPALPAPVATAAASQLTIGSQNLHLLFDDVNDPWNATDCGAADVDFCPSTVRWNQKLNLLSRQIREQLKSPMVIGVQEIEKLGALQALASKINTDLGPTPPFTYTAFVGAIDNLDGGHQNVGFLIRSNVTILSLVQLNTTQIWSFNGSSQGEVMDRPPYLLRATVDLGSGPFEFAVMVAHQRSLTGIEDLTPLADQIDAHRVRQKRMYQAALTAQAVQQFRAANPDLPFYLVGDFNAFTESDGYADVTGIIQGTTDPALSEYDLSFFNLEGTGANGNIVDPPMIAGSALAPANERYSYQFRDTPQQIDHALMSAAGLERFQDMQFARNNVDQQELYTIGGFANTLGTENPLVSSDHDGFVLFIDARGDSIFANGFED